MTRAMRGAVGALACVAAVAACGDDEGEGTSATGAPITTTTGTTGGSAGSTGGGATGGGGETGGGGSATGGGTTSNGGAGGMGGTGGATGGGGAGGGGIPGWECVGDVTYATPTPGTTSITIDFTAVDYLSNNPVTDYSLKACELSDFDCLAPVDEGAAAAGMVQLALPVDDTAGWTGYFEITGPGLATTLMHVFVPLTQSGATQLFAFTQQTVDLMVAGITSGSGQIPGTGHIGGSLVNCDVSIPPGMSATITPAGSSTTAYFEGGVPNPMLTATTTSNIFAIVNVPAGAGVLEASTVDLGGAVYGEVDYIIRPDALSLIIIIGPTPL